MDTAWAMTLRVERHGDECWAINDALMEYGFGPSFEAALDDFCATVVELYGLLKSEEEHLGPWPQSQLKYIEEHLTWATTRS